MRKTKRVKWKVLCGKSYVAQTDNLRAEFVTPRGVRGNKTATVGPRKGYIVLTSSFTTAEKGLYIFIRIRFFFFSFGFIIIIIITFGCPTIVNNMRVFMVKIKKKKIRNLFWEKKKKVFPTVRRLFVWTFLSQNYDFSLFPLFYHPLIT